MYRFGWSYSGKDVGLFSVAVLVQPCVFGNTRDHDTLNHERWFKEIKVAISLAGDPTTAVWQREEVVWGQEQANCRAGIHSLVLEAILP